MKNISGVQGAAPLWRELMESVFRLRSLHDVLRIDEQPLIETFEPPPDVELIEVCDLADLQAGRGCQTKREEFVPKYILAETVVTAGNAPSADNALEPAGTPVKKMGDSLLCRIPEGVAAPADLILRTFNVLLPPPDPEEATRVRAWAAGHGIPLASNEPCTPEVLAQVQPGAVGVAAINATWRITSPAPGEIITDNVPIVGTAVFNPAEISFYKVEFARADTPLTWITMGETRTTPVVDGQLEMWYAGGLDPGPYVLRLVLVKPDGNWLPPYTVPLTVSD